MLTSIQSRSSAAVKLSQPQKVPARPTPVFGEPVFGEVVTAQQRLVSTRAAGAESSIRSVKTMPRQNSATAKSSSFATPPLIVTKSAGQTLAAKSLTNKTLPTTNGSLLTTRSTTTTAADGETPPPRPVDPADAVRALLTEMGYDTSKMKFEAHEENVSYPGGGYTHKFTSVELPNGRRENFTTDLMARYPAVTANEIKRLMENNFTTASVSVQGFNGGG